MSSLDVTLEQVVKDFNDLSLKLSDEELCRSFQEDRLSLRITQTDSFYLRVERAGLEDSQYFLTFHPQTDFADCKDSLEREHKYDEANREFDELLEDHELVMYCKSIGEDGVPDGLLFILPIIEWLVCLHLPANKTFRLEIKPAEAVRSLNSILGEP